jgi:DNA-directed RNA polymerase specialized sigma24 family protein
MTREPYFPDRLLGRASLPVDTRLDIESWIGKMPPRLREYATLAYRGTTGDQIRQIMGVTRRQVEEIRRRIRRLWRAEMA